MEVRDGFQMLGAALYPMKMVFYYHFRIFFWMSSLMVMLARKQFQFFFSFSERTHSNVRIKPTVMF